MRYQIGQGQALPLQYESIQESYRPVGSARSTKRRYRSDYSEAISQAGRAHRLRRIPFLRLAHPAGWPARPILSFERIALSGRVDLNRRKEFRLRLFARARAVVPG